MELTLGTVLQAFILATLAGLFVWAFGALTSQRDAKRWGFISFLIALGIMAAVWFVQNVGV